MAIDTVMLCFLEDMSINDGSEDRPYYADGALKRFVDNHADKVKKKSKRKSGRKGKKKKKDKKKDKKNKGKKGKKSGNNESKSPL
jgi:hypothetical protein